MKESQPLITLNIHDLGSNGEGVGYFEGSTFFVAGALPGETVEARLLQKSKKLGKAALTEVKKASLNRVQPVCKHFGTCGGCQLMHLSYEAQLLAKQQRVASALKRIGKIDHPVIQPCLPSPSPLAYRNKIQLPVRKNADDIAIGLYSHSSHDLIEIDSCHIHCPLGEHVFQKAKEIIKSSGIQPYDPETGKGELRHLLIKTAVKTEQVLVILVTTSHHTPILRSIAKEIIQKCPQVKGVVHNINEKHDNVILGKTTHTLEGSDSIVEQIGGMTFKVSPTAFFQVNHAQAEHIYNKVLELAELKGTETVLDAYCGVGTLSLILAQRAQQVLGVESVSEAIEDARENARMNGIANAQFTCALSESYVHRLSGIDIAVLNPPRKGCEQGFLEGIKQLKPKMLIYVSCDPATLARDVAYFVSIGYQLDLVQPYDMFPQTAHVETVVKMLL